ncbi:MAG TPA: hypothetical protein VHD36_21215 [Pirellulales bacterium]|nr:hypothetical protein [Pirellulales bacterium]
MNRNSFTSRLLLATSNDAVLLLLAFFAYRNGLWPIAVLLAVGAIVSTGYVLLRKSVRP